MLVPIYADSILHIAHDQREDWLYVNWQAAQDEWTVQQGGAVLLDYLRQHPRPKLLNDNRQVGTLWAAAAEWVGSTYLPLLAEAGVQQLAWINAHSLYGRLSTGQAVAYAQRPLTRLFDDYEEAVRWLRAG